MNPRYRIDIAGSDRAGWHAQVYDYAEEPALHAEATGPDLSRVLRQASHYVYVASGEPVQRRIRELREAIDRG